MKKASRKAGNDMRAEYDFASMKGGLRGKYVKRYRAGTNLVLLDPEVAEVFPNDAAVNRALRAVINMTKAVGRRELSRKALPPPNRARRRGRRPAQSRAARG